MQTKALITSCSNKFFPLVINLLTSIKVNYPGHPPIYVYDLGLLSNFRYELSQIEGVTVIPMPHFCPHWRSCYTWKTYIFAHPLADLNFYIDAGCQVLRPLDDEFKYISDKNLLLLDNKQPLKDLIPPDYCIMFDIPIQTQSALTFQAGIIGFSKDEKVLNMFKKAYAASKAGLALGFSENNLWRNKGKNKNIFIRDCEYFRHDQSLINLFFRKEYFEKTHEIVSDSKYHYASRTHDPHQAIWHLRLLWERLEYLNMHKLHKVTSNRYLINRLYIKIFIFIKVTNIFIKKKLGIIKT